MPCARCSAIALASRGVSPRIRVGNMPHLSSLGHGLRLRGISLSATVSRVRCNSVACSYMNAAIELPSNQNAQPTQLSTTFIPTLRAAQQAASGDESPASSLLSLRLLLRGGYIRQSSSGLYTLLPIGLRMLRKIERIIDEEFRKTGAAQLEMPGLLSSALWRRTGRFETMGSELYSLKDRRNQEFVLGPTHEEEVTKLVGNEVQSAKQLPVKVYQITRKNRDEPRPRSGLLRTREFTMADMYTFDESLAAAETTYDKVREAYARIMNRLLGAADDRVSWRMADADTGAIGGKRSHEYHIEDPIGEDMLLSCPSCDYCSNAELAVSLPKRDVALLPFSAEDVKVDLYGTRPPDVSALPGTFQNSEAILTAVIAPNDRQINTLKVGRALAPGSVELKGSRVHGGPASWDWSERPEGPLAGYDRLELLADQECELLELEELLEAVRAKLVHFSTPATSGDSSNPSTWPTLADFFPSQLLERSPLLSTSDRGDNDAPALSLRLADVREAADGDTCSQCGDAPLTATRAIEVGHTFLLGTRYATALGVGFSGGPGDSNLRQPFQMGCYGIGVSRLIGAIAQRASQSFVDAVEGSSVAEASSQKRQRLGFVWPQAVAPFSILVLPSSPYTTEKKSAVEALCSALEDGVRFESTEEINQFEDGDVALDDRLDLSLGVRLNDADLVGYPRVIILGRHWERTGEVEMRTWRAGTQHTTFVDLETLLRSGSVK